MVVDQLSELEVDRLFHALADATRRDIVLQVIAVEQSVSELARRYPISVTAVQKHVAVLESAGLVSRRRQGREQRVAIRGEAIQRARQLLDEYERIWRGRMARMGEILSADNGKGKR